MPISNYPNGFANGVSLRGLPILNSYSGKVFWVDGNAGGGRKGTFDHPLATIMSAIALCVDNRGDIIMVKSNHYEELTAAADILADVAGVTIIGLGRGTDMPELDYTLAAGSVSIGAANVALQNLNFHANVPEVVVGVDVVAAMVHAALIGCKFDVETTGTDEFLISANVNAGSHFALFEGCDIDNGLGAAVHALKLTGAANGVTIARNIIQGDYSTANIGGITTLSSKIDINDNLLINGGAAALNTEPVIELLTGTSGIVRNNYIVCNLATMLAAIAADTVILFENYYNEDITGTGALIGTPSADG